MATVHRVRVRGPLAPYLGRPALFRTHEGDLVEGVLEAPLAGPAAALCSGYPIVRLPDGRWGRCDRTLLLLEEA